MQNLGKGQNVPLGATDVRVSLRWSTSGGQPVLDLSGLLLGGDGKVLSDAAFVFYNQPQDPSGCVRHEGRTDSGPASTDTIAVRLGAAPAGVDRIVIAASTEGLPFGQVRDAVVTVSELGGGGTALLEHTLAVEGPETCLLVGELYLRNGEWKFRAISQGYASGLAGLATDFGVDVGDPAPSSASAAPAATPEPLVVPPQPAQPVAEAAPEPLIIPEQTPAPEATAPDPAAPDPVEMERMIGLIRIYADACQAVMDAVDQALECANHARGARNMSHQRPQHEISIRNFSEMADKKEQEFSGRYGVFMDAVSAARNAGLAVVHGNSPVNPELLMMVNLEDQVYGMIGAAIEFIREDMPSDLNAFLDSIPRINQLIQDSPVLFAEGFQGFIYGTAQQQAASSAAPMGQRVDPNAL